MQQQQILESVLLSVEALISFRRRYRGGKNIVFGLDLLMSDSTNPRSLIYQIELLRKYLSELPHNDTQALGLTPESRQIIKSLNDILLADLESLEAVDEASGLRKNLITLMTQITNQLEQFTALLSDKYFDHTAGPQPLVNKTDL